MLLTEEKFFCETLDTSIPELSSIAEVYREKGIEAAEKLLADYVRKVLDPDTYFKLPYYERENAWAYREETDIDVSERVMKGKMMSCGFMHEFPNGVVDWEINPTENGYKEWTWQLSRHHELRCLGHCYKETGDERYAETYVKLLMSWCEQAVCPENLGGGHTNCWRTIEAGIRMTKIWHYAFHACYKSPHFTDHVMATYMRSIWEHAHRLSTNFTSHNWLIMEMAGLSHIGMIYRWFKDCDKWLEFAYKKLDEEIDNQIYPDSFQYELTTGYHGVVLRNYEYVINSSKVLGYPLPDGLSNNLKRGYEMYMKLAEPDLHTPALNDGGRANSAGEMSLALKYFPEREDFKYFATNRKEGTPPEYKSIALPYAGMASLRTGWEADDMYVFMESAPFGKAHQHEDKLNVLMYAYGKDVLPDMGSYAYDSSEMRKLILDTRSHNCAMVDDRSQFRRKGYTWHPEDIKKRSNLRWGFTEDIDTVEGRYDEGYGSDFIDVTHDRKIIFFKKGVASALPFTLVIDRLKGNDEKNHKYAVSYQTAYKPHTVDGKVFTQDFGDGVTFSIIGTATPELVIAQKEPYWMGWRPKHVAGGLEPEHYHAPCVRYTVENAPETRIVTLLYPSNNGSVAIKDIIASSDISSTEITLVLESGEKLVIDEKNYPANDTEEYIK